MREISIFLIANNIALFHFVAHIEQPYRRRLVTVAYIGRLARANGHLEQCVDFHAYIRPA